MPMYEYTCQKCEHDFEELVFNGEAVACPQCQSGRVARQLSVPAKPTAHGTQALPRACDTSLPPCSPTCCRL